MSIRPPAVVETVSPLEKDHTIMKSKIARLFTLLLSAVLVASPMAAQTAPFATGFRGPSKVAFSHAGNLIVTEAGTTEPNSGRISLVDRTSGARRTLIDGLPSGVHIGTPSSPAGPSALALQGSTLYVAISNGDSVMPGPLPRTEIPNPTPSSPILSSILALRADRSLDVVQGGFTLGRADHALLKSGAEVRLTNPAGEELRIRLVTDFPDYIPDPTPAFAGNVRLSNPFAIAALGQTLYVADASHNLVRRVDITTGAFSTVTTFANMPNPTPVGGPFVEAVPDSIRIRGNELLVGLLSGFPFPAGVAMVRRVSFDGSVNEPLLTGLTSVIDVRPLGAAASSPALVLEFSTNQTQSAPGRLVLSAPGSAPQVLATGLITPTSLVLDERNGTVFVTHIGPGIITKIDLSASLPAAVPASVIPIAGTANGAFDSRFVTAAQLTNPHAFPISGTLLFRRQGVTSSTSDPQLAYTLAPFQTRSFADIAGAFGTTGIGSIDVFPAVGESPSILTTVRDERASSSASVQIPLVTAAQVLNGGTRGMLTLPADASSTRYNIGIRTLTEGATLAITQYDASGTAVRSVTVSYPAGYFVQTSVASLLGAAPGAGHSLGVSVVSGSAIVYGTATDNTGRGMTFQIATGVPQ